MRKWLETLGKTFAAVSFAEAGEHDTAMEVAGIQYRSNWKAHTLSKVFENVFAAVTYAEAGCPEMALEFIKNNAGQARAKSLKTFLENVGLQGVRVRYGLVIA